jgi:ABC-type multidrug transport system fused ATPase/permease subunit
MKLYSYIKFITKNNFSLVLLSYLILLISGLIETASLLIIAPIVDTIINNNQESQITKVVTDIFNNFGIEFDIWYLFLIYFLVILVKSLFDVFTGKLIIKMKYRVILKTITNTYKSIFKAGWEYISSEKQGRLLNSFTREIDRLGDSLAATGRLISASTKFIIFLFIPFLISWKITLVTFGFILIIGLPFFLMGKFSRRLGKVSTQTSNEYLSILQENFGLAKIIISFAKQAHSLKNMLKIFDEHVDATIKSQTFALLLSNLYIPFGILGIILIYYLGQVYLIPISSLAVLFAAYYKIIPVMSEMISSKNSFDDSYTSYEQIISIHQKTKEMTKPNGDIKFNSLKHSLEFKNVSFSYNEEQKTIDNLSFKIKKGEFIALVGKSGGGKTTIIDLILGLNTVQKGEILIDDIKQSKYDIDTFREKTGYVPQGAALFNDTIENNIKWSNNYTSENVIKKICLDTYSSEFIEKFPEKYNTLVGERGVKLSGGQLQRIALARALVKDPNIIILDEATSSLDTQSEKKIQKSLDGIYRIKTIIVIAHRLSTIIKADKIFVIDSGKILEQGNYRELIEKNGMFKKMLDDQKFIEIE